MHVTYFAKPARVLDCLCCVDVGSFAKGLGILGISSGVGKFHNPKLGCGEAKADQSCEIKL